MKNMASVTTFWLRTWPFKSFLLRILGILWVWGVLSLTPTAFADTAVMENADWWTTGAWRFVSGDAEKPRPDGVTFAEMRGNGSILASGEMAQAARLTLVSGGAAEFPRTTLSIQADAIFGSLRFTTDTAAATGAEPIQITHSAGTVTLTGKDGGNDGLGAGWRWLADELPEESWGIPVPDGQVFGESPYLRISMDPTPDILWGYDIIGWLSRTGFNPAVFLPEMDPMDTKTAGSPDFWAAGFSSSFLFNNRKNTYALNIPVGDAPGDWQSVSFSDSGLIFYTGTDGDYVIDLVSAPWDETKPGNVRLAAGRDFPHSDVGLSLDGPAGSVYSLRGDGVLQVGIVNIATGNQMELNGGTFSFREIWLPENGTETEKTLVNEGTKIQFAEFDAATGEPLPSRTQAVTAFISGSYSNTGPAGAGTLIMRTFGLDPQNETLFLPPGAADARGYRLLDSDRLIITDRFTAGGTLHLHLSEIDLTSLGDLELYDGLAFQLFEFSEIAASSPDAFFDTILLTYNSQTYTFQTGYDIPLTPLWHLILDPQNADTISLLQNHGILAFQFLHLPEPSTFLLLLPAAAWGARIAWRRKKR